jgi:hypothetical protein
LHFTKHVATFDSFYQEKINKMDKCFVIQPFDNDKYDRRYNDVFAPAITKAGLEPYRVDKDLSVRIPIADIEKGISESTLCLAEISTDNPNVWYELGYAFACGKDVVMVCSEERQGKFPFDIQHRIVTTYKTGSKSDFEKLEEAIIAKVEAFKLTAKTVEKLATAPVVEREGLQSHEIALSILIMENQLTKEDSISVYRIQSEMKKSGYTNIATSVGIRTLEKQGMLETFMQADIDGEPYIACRLTDKGVNWVLDNQTMLKFRQEPENKK